MIEHVDGRSLRYQHRRGELLQAAGDYVLDNGVARLTLRRVADAVGISHVTLQHHFGTKEELVAEIVEHVLERTFAPREDYIYEFPDPDVEENMRALWSELTSPAGLRDIKLFIEIFGQSQFEGAAYAPAVRRSIEHRLEVVADSVKSLGCPDVEARTFATLVLAQLRGLTIDMLATGERERVDAAFEIVLDSSLRSAAHWSKMASRASVSGAEAARDADTTPAQ